MINRREPLEVRYGPWALVTGASEGIGRSFAAALAQQGFHLVLVARRSHLLEALADNLTQAHGTQCEVLAADLSTAEGVAEVLDRTARHDVGLVVCSAGFGTAGCFLEGDIGEELDMLRVNCGASTALSWGFGRRFRSRGRGGLILLSSIVAFQGVPRSAHYAATKSYVQTLAEGLRAEWADRGIDVLAVAPGPVATGFARRAGLTMGRAENPDVVAAESLNALGRRGTARPGLLAKVLGYSLAMTPRWGRIRIMAMVMRGMTKHHAA